MSSGHRFSTQDLRDEHLFSLRFLSLVSLALTLSLTYAASQLPLFDQSPELLLPPTGGIFARLAAPLYRWDSFHFVDIAAKGYAYEHEWAFFPGTPFVMRIVGDVLRRLQREEETTIAHLLAGGGLASLLCGTITTLYDLTMHHFGSPSVAYLTCLLSLLPSSPVTLRFSAYTEPFFTYFSYRGMLCCARSQWLHASLFFAVASSFRSNGIMLAGYILWGLVLGPLLDRKTVTLGRALQATLLTGLIFAPFIYHQYSAYVTFCADPSEDVPPWCSYTLPLVYGYVQDKYWNVGFLRYWTPSQAPNILLAAPVLAALFSFGVAHVTSSTISLMLSHPLLSSFGNMVPTSLRRPNTKSPFLTNKNIIPHVLHALALSMVLLFAAHTQIALRFAASMPTTYWAAAWLMVEHPRAGKWWVTWSVVWGAVSNVLWAVFLPPA